MSTRSNIRPLLGCWWLTQPLLIASDKPSLLFIIIIVTVIFMWPNIILMGISSDPNLITSSTLLSATIFVGVCFFICKLKKILETDLYPDFQTLYRIFWVDSVHIFSNRYTLPNSLFNVNLHEEKNLVNLKFSLKLGCPVYFCGQLKYITRRYNKNDLLYCLLSYNIINQISLYSSKSNNCI